jgi:3-methyladenine DNA glycosylase AlkD
MPGRLKEIHDDLIALSDAGHAETSRWFFKTGPGEYGENDRFRGIRVPALRKLAAKHRDVSAPDVLPLLKSDFHEDRMIALFFLVGIYARGDEEIKKNIYHTYLNHTEHINNWDLVDCSADKIVGDYLMARDKAPLHELACSGSLWERRIAIVATFHFIRNNVFDDTFRIADVLLNDPEDLIHKATGWMLREAGKRDENALETFLKGRYRRMPRTMLRYAIERFPETRRQAYLKGWA